MRTHIASAHYKENPTLSRAADNHKEGSFDSEGEKTYNLPARLSDLLCGFRVLDKSSTSRVVSISQFFNSLIASRYFTFFHTTGSLETSHKILSGNPSTEVIASSVRTES